MGTWRKLNMELEQVTVDHIVLSLPYTFHTLASSQNSETWRSWTRSTWVEKIFAGSILLWKYGQLCLFSSTQDKQAVHAVFRILMNYHALMIFYSVMSSVLWTKEFIDVPTTQPLEVVQIVSLCFWSNGFQWSAQAFHVAVFSAWSRIWRRLRQLRHSRAGMYVSSCKSMSSVVYQISDVCATSRIDRCPATSTTWTQYSSEHVVQDTKWRENRAHIFLSCTEL